MDFKIIQSFEELAVKCEKWRLIEKRIVLTIGCFDLLHGGHVRYLSEAKKYGDKLIVGIKSDDLVRAIKGEGRPIRDAVDRAIVIAGFSCVDLVMISNQDEDLINTVLPDVYVASKTTHTRIGEDQRCFNLLKSIGSDIIELNAKSDFYSTTKIVDKILVLHNLQFP